MQLLILIKQLLILIKQLLILTLILILIMLLMLILILILIQILVLKMITVYGSGESSVTRCGIKSSQNCSKRSHDSLDLKFQVSFARKFYCQKFQKSRLIWSHWARQTNLVANSFHLNSFLNQKSWHSTSNVPPPIVVCFSFSIFYSQIFLIDIRLALQPFYNICKSIFGFNNLMLSLKVDYLS